MMGDGVNYCPTSVPVAYPHSCWRACVEVWSEHNDNNSKILNKKLNHLHQNPTVLCSLSQENYDLDI